MEAARVSNIGTGWKKDPKSLLSFPGDGLWLGEQLYCSLI